ncbi:SanA/YdcF family protein [Gordonia sp. (in: high G+C Gram-positive bacteria)]|uniref:SanA/YdcF family protein n=1 Tax=Gordonia sp. (in: high G+C Gram-positive bacteria) TaxID=84139 RepID=UPI003C73B781
MRIRFLTAAVLAVEVLVTIASLWVWLGSRGRVVDAAAIAEDAPRTMIVLGAKVRDGQVGDYVGARLDVAIAAYRDGRIDRILNSGNDSDSAGNEVTVMRNYLEAAGVPSTAITDDRLGLNTNATCRRAAAIYGIDSAMIVTQNFHIARAVTLCQAWGIDATGVIAPCNQCSTLSLIRNQFREALLSRPRAVIDALRAGHSDG